MTPNAGDRRGQAVPFLDRVVNRAPLRAWDDEVADLPWADPAFSERMLREHLDQRHDLASRRLTTIERQAGQLVRWLGLRPDAALLDLTCGPGLVARAFAERGIAVTGVDVAPAAIRHAREITAGLACAFIEGDVRVAALPPAAFDAAIYLYGQLAVLRPTELAPTLARIRTTLRPGAALGLEIREPSLVDRATRHEWWTGTDDLWGAGTHLVLGERAWDAVAGATVERWHVLDREGELSIHGVTERILEPETLRPVLVEAGFPEMEIHPGWDGLAFDGAAEWLAVIAR